MYIPPAFNEPSLDVQRELIRAFPLGLLITGANQHIDASPLPFIWLESAGDGLGILQSHCSRGNTHWQAMNGADALVVFQGWDTYITPSWYAAKQEHGKVVPTWNYATVHARGTVRTIEDVEWLRAQVTRLTDEHEGAQPDAWKVTDAPSSYIDAHLKGIVGIEIVVRAIEGKWKVSQNRPMADRRSVATGLDAQGEHAMADLVKRYGGVE